MLNWIVVTRTTEGTLKDTLPRDKEKEIIVCVMEDYRTVHLEDTFFYDEFYDFFDRWPNLEMAWAYINFPAPWYVKKGDLE